MKNLFKHKILIAICIIIALAGCGFGFNIINDKNMADQIMTKNYNKNISKYVTDNYGNKNIYSIYENNILGNSSVNLYGYGKKAENGKYIFYVSADNEAQGIVRYEKDSGEEKAIIDSYVQNLCIKDDQLYYINLADRFIYSSNFDGTANNIMLNECVRSFQFVGDDLLVLNGEGDKIYYMGSEQKIELENEIDFFSIIGMRLIYVSDNKLISYDMETNKEQTIYTDCISGFVYNGDFFCETSVGIEIIDSRGNNKLLVDGDAYILSIDNDTLFFNKQNKIYLLTLDGTKLKEIDTYKGYIRNFIILENEIIYDQVFNNDNNLMIEHKYIMY